MVKKTITLIDVAFTKQSPSVLLELNSKYYVLHNMHLNSLILQGKAQLETFWPLCAINALFICI